MRILVTGSAGFVGGSIGRAAARSGHAVLGLARRSQPERDWPGAHHQTDVAQSDLAGIIREFNPDMVFHGAGTASVGASMASPLDDLRAALLTWANVLDGVRRSGLKPLIIFPSSAAVYGNPQTLPVAESAAVAPISPYGFHKAACELVAAEYARCFDLRIIVARIFSLYGPSQRRLLVWELFNQFVGPEPTVWLQGTGNETRDFLHVDDLADAVLALATRPSDNQPGALLETLNLASGLETRALDVAEHLARCVVTRKEIRCRGTRRAGDPDRWLADTRRLQSALPGWSSRQLQEGLGRCVEAWQAERG